MTNEIKEILDEPKILMLSYGNYISLDDYIKLKDYITNLQEENKNLKKQYAKEEKKLFHDNEILQQRIDTAVDYIENNFLYHYGSYEKPIVFEDNYIQELYDILRGDE